MSPLSLAARPSHLIIVTRTLTIFGQRLETLIDETGVLLIDIETEKTESARRAAAYAVEKLKRFVNEIIVVFAIVLLPQIVLEEEKKDVLSRECRLYVGHFTWRSRL